MRFNTTLVQLKVHYDLERKRDSIFCFNTTLVQLKASAKSLLCWDACQFQYHTGPIKSDTIAPNELRYMKLSFNTTLVQLKEKRQTLKQTIGTCFNTTLVQLKGGVRGVRGLKSMYVSIPHWSN